MQYLRTALLTLLAGVIVLGALAVVVAQPVFFAGTATQASGADPSALEAHVRTLTGELSPRSHDPGQLARSAQYIHDAFARHGEPEYQEFEAGGKTYRNVVLRLGDGEGPLVVVGAHYDAAFRLPGADDNASGVAGLLELARMLAARPPRGQVELVAYALEEPPFFDGDDMGSFHHAQRLRAEGRTPKLMIGLEMIGFFSDEPWSQSFPLAGMYLIYPSRGNFIGIVGRFDEIAEVREVKAAFHRRATVPAYSMNAPTFVPGVTLSDHSSYWRSGFKAVMVTDTAFFRNENYHMPGDTADTLDYGRMAQVVNGVHEAVVALAGA